jgi:hypothetical protein
MGICYSGVRGNGRIGCGIADRSRAPAEIAEWLFREGWAKASVFLDGKLAGEVKIIEGKRDWWGEPAPA